MSEKQKIYCECNSFDCRLLIGISYEKALKIKEHRNNVIIIDGCKTGPNPTDIFVSKEEGYTIYKD